MSARLEIVPFSLRRDLDELFDAYAAVVEEGGAFPRTPPADVQTFRSAWLDGTTSVQVARRDGRLAGSYFLRPAFPYLGAHIVNAGYLVVTELRRRGIGRALVDHSMAEAARHGFDAMLFNLVREHNPSRKLWERVGFQQIGRIPDAILGEGALIYWRRLP